MKLTKTETVKAFKFQIEGEQEFVAARNKSEALFYMADLGYDLDEIKVRGVGEVVLKKLKGYKYPEIKRGKNTAYQALSDRYKKNSLPFRFWSIRVW